MPSTHRASQQARLPVDAFLMPGVALASRGLQTLVGMAAFAGSGILIVVSPLLAFLPVVAISFLALAAASTDLLLLIAVGLRNFTDPAADSGSIAGVGGLNPSGVIGLGIIGLAFVRLATTRKHRVTAEVAALLLGFSAWFMVGGLQFGFQTSLLKEFVRVVSVVAIGVIATSWHRDDSVTRTADVILLACAIPAVVAVGQAAMHLAQFGSGTWRSAGTFAHPNTAATVFGICTVLSFWRTSRRPAPYHALTGLFAAAVLVTGSVGGYVQVGVSFLVLAPLLSVRARRRALAAVALATVLLAGFAASPIGRARIAEISSGQKKLVIYNKQVKRISSIKWRYRNWKDEIQAWQRKPVTGFGLGTTDSIVTPDGGAPHNDPLRFLVETGILGVFLFGFLTLRLFNAASRLRRTPGRDADVGAVLMAVLLGCFVHAFAENVWTATAPMYALAALTGAAFAVSRRKGSEQSAEGAVP